MDPPSPAWTNNGTYVITAYIATPVRKATADAAEMVRMPKRDRGTTGSGVRLSMATKPTKAIPAPAKRTASCQEYHGKVEPPLRKPSMSKVIQVVSVPTPSQSTMGLEVRSLDSFSPKVMRRMEATPKGRLT